MTVLDEMREDVANKQTEEASEKAFFGNIIRLTVMIQDSVFRGQIHNFTL